jgi:uncharacterized membrane protein YphA (DoxX/SURF4 family)
VLASLQKRVVALHQRRSAQLAIIVLRMLLGFAFLPAGIKKVLRQPFTDATNHGPFHDFLHAFYATGFFYQFVGVVQLLAALLLLSQRFAFAGALIALPVVTAITVFTWSTAVPFTASVATLMTLGMLGVLLWEIERWPVRSQQTTPPAPPLVELRYWQWCGALIVATYVALCVSAGGVYRPRPSGPHDAAFWIMNGLPLLPFGTWLLERRRRRRSQ